MKNKSLFSEIKNDYEKLIFYRSKIYKLSKLKKRINNLIKKISIKKKGIVSLSTKNKINFIINFYACNALGFPVYLNNNNYIKNIYKEKLDINYIIKNNKIYKISKNYKKNKYHIIIKTSGSTSLSKYVLLKNKSISFICKNMNNEMFKKKSKYNELIFCPIDHAFGFGRLHSLMISKNNFTLTDDISFSELEKLIKIDSLNSISIPAKILNNLMKIKGKVAEKILKNIKYIQVSTGLLPLKLRKKIINSKINLFINYGMTEAMRSTFLNCNKHKNKINTEGKPFGGVKIKIDKKGNKFGKILIMGKNLAYGYSDKKEWKKRYKKKYFDSGDVGYLDKDNFLIFKSRDKNKLNVNGNIYYIEEIENILKKKFLIENIKITQIKNTYIYLIIDKNIKSELIYNFLRKNKINISFDEIIRSKFKNHDTGKINLTNMLKKIDDKK